MRLFLIKSVFPVLFSVQLPETEVVAGLIGFGLIMERASCLRFSSFDDIGAFVWIGCSTCECDGFKEVEIKGGAEICLCVWTFEVVFGMFSDFEILWDRVLLESDVAIPGGSEWLRDRVDLARTLLGSISETSFSGSSINAWIRFAAFLVACCEPLEKDIDMYKLLAGYL